MVTDASGTVAKNCRLSAWMILFSPEKIELMGVLFVTLIAALYDLAVLAASTAASTAWFLLLCGVVLAIRGSVGTCALTLASWTASATLTAFAAPTATATLVATALLAVWAAELFLFLCI